MGLVLTRREGECIRIGDEIDIIIERIYTERGRPAVKVRIEAPTEVQILRTELLERPDHRR